MAKCETCGKTYYSKKCDCNKIKKIYNIPKTNTHPRKEKSEININMKNIAIVIITISILLIAILQITDRYQKTKETQMIMKMMYGTDDIEEIEKMNKQMMKKNEKYMKEFRKLLINE